MDNKRLDEIEARANAAPRGPWAATGYDYILGADGSPVLEVRGHGAEVSGNRPEGSQVATEQFTAHARQDVPDLVARVRVLFTALHAAARYIDRSRDMLSSPNETRLAKAEYEAAVEKV
jgi:hypothetical protein